MQRTIRVWAVLASVVLLRMSADAAPPVVKLRVAVDTNAVNRLVDDGWRPWEAGFTRDGEIFVCDNGLDGRARRGVSQSVMLNQKTPVPIVASAWSRADAVGGSADADYSLYLDLLYMDGTPLWGQISPFTVGTHDWERREVVVMPAKPVRRVSFHLLLRGHRGRAAFRDPMLYEVAPSARLALFERAPVECRAPAQQGFQVCDTAAGSDWVGFGAAGDALGLMLEARESTRGAVTVVDAALRSADPGRDRAVTLVYALPVDGDGWQWLADPRTAVETEAPWEYTTTTRTEAVGGGALSRYPLAAVRRGTEGLALGLDLDKPAFFRLGYSAGTHELYAAFDLGLAPERPTAAVRLCVFRFDPAWGFRGAWAAYQAAFPAYFECRTPEQGLWMPFAKISEVDGWQDFGFKFKEGNNETVWDDAHGILTFRYTEPQTWWMALPKGTPRTMQAALDAVAALAARGDKRAQVFATSAYHDVDGNPVGLFRDTPWCNGVVWSINSSPGVPGTPNDFGLRWNAVLRDELYGPGRRGNLDGEYIDSSECYVTADLDYRRDHFAGASAPLTFGRATHRPAIYKGLAVYDYARAQAIDVHALGKLMMANSTPSRLCWLAPWLDVMGTETDWHRGGKWMPMSDSELLYRRALCGPKPFCFLMNSNFDEFPHTLVEKYMKRCLAYGMFPGFFSHNASEKQYFTRPALYNRDRDLFRKYVPLCKRVAEAGWRPVTGVRSSDDHVYVERFGDAYLTVFNDSEQRRTTRLTLDGFTSVRASDLLANTPVEWHAGTAELTLDPDDVVVLDVQARGAKTGR